MKKFTVLALALVVVGSLLLVTVASAQGGTVSRGGLLYDKWWKVVGADAPADDHPLWATQSNNTRSGADTWRCKECHGWDYLGKDGAYSSGSHMTGFSGVYDAAQSKSVDELAAALKGATNPDHDFSSLLDDAAVNDLATFMKEGLVDVPQYVDYETKAPTSADTANGNQIFDAACAACHGADGSTLNFGDDAEPLYVGDIADSNPQEFLHKARSGQPGTPMPSGIDLGWSVQDGVDVLAYAQTLPTGEEAAPPASAQGDNVSRGGLLYDKWWNVVGADAPADDHPLWATQSNNTRSGADTWRCKECHGWDYLGKDGAYSSGSHMTGFNGVYDPAQSKSVDELAAALKGATNPDHDFSSLLDDAAISDLTTFMKEGLVDVPQYIDYETKAPTSADTANGNQLFDATCVACHGSDGTTLNFGDEAAAQYVADVGVSNPQEFLHKVRSGQPGTNMPSGIDLGWSVQDGVDVLAYAQTLPTGAEATVAVLPETGGSRQPWPPQLLVMLLAGLLAVGVGMTVMTVKALRRARL